MFCVVSWLEGEKTFTMISDDCRQQWTDVSKHSKISRFKKKSQIEFREISFLSNRFFVNGRFPHFHQIRLIFCRVIVRRVSGQPSD